MKSFFYGNVVFQRPQPKTDPFRDPVRLGERCSAKGLGGAFFCIMSMVHTWPPAGPLIYASPFRDDVADAHHWAFYRSIQQGIIINDR